MKTMLRRTRRIRVHKAEVRRLAREKLGITSTRALANLLDLDETNLMRILNGRHQPGGAIVAGLLDVLDVPFEAVFAIEAVDQPAP